MGWSRGLAVHGCYAQGFRLSQDHTLKFVSASGPVSSPFRFLFLLLTFLWNLLPVEQWRAERQSQFKLFLLLCPLSVTPGMEGELEGAAVLATQGDQAMKHLSLRRLETKERETRVT